MDFGMFDKWFLMGEESKYRSLNNLGTDGSVAFVAHFVMEVDGSLTTAHGGISVSEVYSVLQPWQSYVMVLTLALGTI